MAIFILLLRFTTYNLGLLSPILESSLGCLRVEKNLVSVRDFQIFCLVLLNSNSSPGIPEIDDRSFISSPGYPTSYSENAYCYWEVDVPYDVEVILEFNPRSVAFHH